MKGAICQRVRLVTVGVVCMAAALVACNRTNGDDGSTASTAAKTHLDSSAGDVAQYSLMTNPVGWLTDSNLVALAAIVNEAPVHLARVESQQSANQQVHEFALEIIRDHAALQTSIDSLAAKRRVPSQRPAVAGSIQAPYDSAVATLSTAPLQQLAATFLALEDHVHTLTLTDFSALAGNATDPDLRALFAIRATTMEQRHVARAKQLATSLAQADSAKQAARPGRKP